MPDPEAEDRRLVQDFLRNKDEPSFRILYRRHTPALYALALRLLGGNRPDAEDAVQETWLRATQGLSVFRWDSSLRTWLCGIAIRCSRNLLARRLRINSLDDANELSRSLSSHSDLERQILRLPEGYRQVFVLHDIEGYTHEEISKHLGIHEGTSKSQLFHARRILREQMTSPKGGKT
jgi:RNA polymerase sigma-70 factor (ECF subfamily)